MAQGSEITARAYNGHLLRIAWSYVQIGMPLRGLGILHNVSPAYLQGPYQEDAAGDRELAEVGGRFAAYLVEYGFVAGVDRLDVTPTGQVSGQA